MLGNKPLRLRHGHSAKAKSPLYRTWRNMRNRCLNPNKDGYQYYGGRGIRVCDEWSRFERFRDWALANGYQESLSIDRIDNDGNYEPSNCRWITMKANIRKMHERYGHNLSALVTE